MRRTHATGARTPLPLLSYGFRPFFLGAALWGLIAIALWILMLTKGLRLPSRLPPLDWHIHAMLFEFVPAAVAGFLLTAISNWTGRPPVNGSRLGALVGLWILSCVNLLLSAWVPAGFAILFDMAFPVTLTVVVAYEIISARRQRNYFMIVPVAVLTLAQLLMDLGVEEGLRWLTGYGWRMGLAAILILISAIATRIVPNFTRNWLMAHQRGLSLSVPKPLDRAAHAVLHTGLVIWIFFPHAQLTGVVLVAGAALNLWRLVYWQGWTTMTEPLLFVLHIGYVFLTLGVAALGWTDLATGFPLGAAIHTLTVGAIGTMILAVMTRVSRGHTGHALSADAGTVLIYLLIILAAVARVTAALVNQERVTLWTAAAILWISAFGLFAVRYTPLLLHPRKHQPMGSVQASK